MPRELLILRHAKSDWDAGAHSDFERPLNRRGQRDAPRVGSWLNRKGLIPDLVISSPAERARQTALEVCRGLDIGEGRIVWEPRLYAAGVPQLLEALVRCPAQATRVLVVGHNPGLEELLRYLVGDDLDVPADDKLLPTAALARLAMPEDWAHIEGGCARLLSVTRPK